MGRFGVCLLCPCQDHKAKNWLLHPSSAFALRHSWNTSHCTAEHSFWHDLQTKGFLLQCMCCSSTFCALTIVTGLFCAACLFFFFLVFCRRCCCCCFHSPSNNEVETGARTQGFHLVFEILPCGNHRSVKKIKNTPGPRVFTCFFSSSFFGTSTLVTRKLLVPWCTILLCPLCPSD